MDSSIEEIVLTQLTAKLELAKEANKSCLFFDTQGTAITFFSYKGVLVECAKMQVQKAMGGITVDEIKENYRKQNYYAMKSGDTMCFYVSKIVPDFKGEYFDPKTTPDSIFNPEAFDKKEVWKATLTEEEDVDFDGNKGWFEKKPDHKVCILSEADPSDEETMKDLRDRLPMEDFVMYRIVESTG